jgi:hypothetical protein
MLERDYLTGRIISISISESDNLDAFGFTEMHLADAFVELCRHLLADGGVLLYGGDLRKAGYTDLLFELIERYRPDSTNVDPAFSSILPWPVHMSMSEKEIAARRQELPRGASLMCLSIDGKIVREVPDRKFRPAKPAIADWYNGLHAMRSFTTDKSHLRILLGGRASNFKGVMPGVAEEALQSLRAQKPLFLAGGFGGCTADICAALGLLPNKRLASDWPGLTEFNRHAFETDNGLTQEENEQLAKTPHIDEVIVLILRATSRLFGDSPGT